MAVPELGKIRIIPDWFNYSVALGQDIAVHTGGIAVTSGYTLYRMLDHRSTTWTQFDSNSSTGQIKVKAGKNISRKTMILFYGDNITDEDGDVQLQRDTTDITANTTATLNSTHIADGFYDADASGLWGFETTTAQELNGFRVTYGTSSFGSNKIKIPICHIGEIFEMPSNAVANLSYNSKYYNKVNTSISGASYSTLYNTNTQRILSASWEYISWEDGSSGIDDFTDMTNQCFGSHVPVAIQLSQSGTVTSDYFMFARIKSWKQTQMSPSLWKVSMVAEELV